jgi:hypothetical protein
LRRPDPDQITFAACEWDDVLKDNEQLQRNNQRKNHAG